MMPDFNDYAPEEFVKVYFPTARVKDEKGLDRVYVDVNGLSTWTEIGNGLTEDRAWEEAALWVYNESYYIEMKKNKKVSSKNL